MGRTFTLALAFVSDPLSVFGRSSFLYLEQKLAGRPQKDKKANSVGYGG